MDGLSDFLSTGHGPFVAAAVMGALGWIIFGLDTQKETRRRSAIEIAQKLTGIGFTRLPVFFNDYAVGDYSGMLRSMKDLHDALADPVQRQAELQKVVKNVLTDLFRDPDQRPQLMKMIDDLKAANLPDTKAVLSDVIGQLANTRTLPDELLDSKGQLANLFGGLLNAVKSRTAAAAAVAPASPAPVAQS